ncbi:MAG: mechanosensitive ion channel family protein [Chitinophagales bacterium]|nr:mechanosensitive ion channel family protein [Chitinophagales bacterium]
MENNPINNQNRKFRLDSKLKMFVIIAFSFLLAHYLLDFSYFSKYEKFIPFLKKMTFSVFLTYIIMLFSRFGEKYINSQNHTEGDRYNLQRIRSLMTTVFIVIVVASFLFQNLYTAAVSFGLISLVLGFALQVPISSFIAWLYIVYRKPYQVGDRIQINQFRGDVIEIGYLDTIILECNGDYLQNDRLSGRRIHFPNSIVLKDEVINYSGPQIPFIWNETAIQIAYTSDVKFVEDCMIKACERDFSERYPEMYEISKKKWCSAVYFRVNTYAWLEAVIQYPVEPEDTTGRRTRILSYALPLLNAEPNKVKFPEGTYR